MASVRCIVFALCSSKSSIALIPVTSQTIDKSDVDPKKNDINFDEDEYLNEIDKKVSKKDNKIASCLQREVRSFVEIDTFLQKDYKKNVQHPEKIDLAKMCLAVFSILLNVYFIFSNFIKIQTSDKDKSSLSKNLVGLYYFSIVLDS